MLPGPSALVWRIEECRPRDSTECRPGASPGGGRFGTRAAAFERGRLRSSSAWGNSGEGGILQASPYFATSGNVPG